MSKQIGIVYSPGFGAGWSSWGNSEQALDQELALAVESGASEEKLREIAKKNWPDAYISDYNFTLRVHWVDEGTPFRVEEYDGNEHVEFGSANYWTIAK